MKNGAGVNNYGAEDTPCLGNGAPEAIRRRSNVESGKFAGMKYTWFQSMLVCKRAIRWTGLARGDGIIRRQQLMNDIIIQGTSYRHFHYLPDEESEACWSEYLDSPWLQIRINKLAEIRRQGLARG